MAETSAAAAAAASDYRTLRIASSTTIKSAVTSCLSHLRQGTDAGPIVLHTHSTSVTTSSDKGKCSTKTGHAAISKLFSVVEIVQREFEEYQRAVWRAEATAARLERQAKDLKLPLKVKADKGKQRADLTAEGPAGDEDAQVSRPKRSILRIYQYNELDYLERAAVAAPETSKADAAVNAEAGPSADVANGLASLDKAIQDHVVRGRKRPLKSHTPTMRITLSTVRLLALERRLTEQGKSWTMQSSPKLTRSRKRKKRKIAQANEGNAERGSDGMDGEDDGLEEEEAYHANAAANANPNGTANAEDDSQMNAEDTEVRESLLRNTSSQKAGAAVDTSGNKRKRKAIDDTEPENQSSGNSQNQANLQVADIGQQNQVLDSQVSHVSESTAVTESSVDRPVVTAPEATSQ